MIVHFLHGVFLWLIIPAAVLIGLAARVGRRRLTGAGLLLMVVSIACAAMVLIALAEPYVAAERGNTHVFLADVSNSLSDADLSTMTRRIQDLCASQPKEDTIRIVGFAAYPMELSVSAGDRAWDLADLRRQKKEVFAEVSGTYGDQTDIQAAILFAQAMIKRAGTIYLFTDGLETRGLAETIIGQTAKQGIRFQFEILGQPRAGEVVLADVMVPPQLRQGQNASLQVLLDASEETAVQIEMRNPATGTSQRFPYDIQAGINTVSLPIDTSSAAIVSYQITVHAEGDTIKDNNSRRVAIPVLDKPQVYVLDAEPGQTALAALQSWLADAASVQPLVNAEELNTADLLIIADADVKTLTPEWTEQIRRAVDGGLGLMIFPGPRLIQDRLLAEGAFAELLPVHVYQYGKKTNPDTTVVFIIDTSGSMTGSRIAVAREIARQAITHLAPYDKVGIVEFYGNRRWAAPIQSAANQLDIYRALNRLTAGGGTVILPAMEEAYYALLNVNTTTRHIVVLSDGGVENADYEAMLRKIADSRISVSTILVGPTTHTGFMAELAQWGQGCFFHAEDRFILPDMNFKSILDKTGAPFQHNTDPLRSPYPLSLLSGVSLERLAGDWDYLPSQLRTGAQSVLELSNGQPLAAMWNYSLGGVVFFSADVFHQGTVRQTGSEDFPALMANLARKA